MIYALDAAFDGTWRSQSLGQERTLERSGCDSGAPLTNLGKDTSKRLP